MTGVFSALFNAVLDGLSVDLPGLLRRHLGKRVDTEPLGQGICFLPVHKQAVLVRSQPQSAIVAHLIESTEREMPWRDWNSSTSVAPKRVPLMYQVSRI